MIRNPDAIRPWQHVLNPLSGYLVLAQALWDSRDYAEAWNFGPDDADARPGALDHRAPRRRSGASRSPGTRRRATSRTRRTT